MADVFDYLAWRGELTLAQSPFNCVDALILSVLAYMSFGDAAPGGEAVELGTAAQALLARGEGEPGARNGTDRRLLEALAGSARFCGMRLLACEECVDPRREMQFGAFTALTGDGAVFVAYRGTDNTLVGWKEDLNMSFAPVVAGQRRAVQYLERAAGMAPGPLRLGGHSKGGNLAVYAGAFCAPETQARIEAVFNNDGPGFAPEVLEAGGYRNILPRVFSSTPVMARTSTRALCGSTNWRTVTAPVASSTPNTASTNRSRSSRVRPASQSFKARSTSRLPAVTCSSRTKSGPSTCQV